MRFNVSAALGHAPDIADVHILGTDGAIRLRQPVGGALALSAGNRGKADLEPVEIDPAKRGAWRVEEEFASTHAGQGDPHGPSPTAACGLTRRRVGSAALDRDASAVRCARALTALGFRTWTVQDRLGEGNLCAYRAVGLRRSDRCAVENHGVAARLEGWPEQRDLRLSLYVLDCGSAERASDQAAAQMHRDGARVRSILADRSK